MKTIPFESRETWLRARLGKITGTRLKDIVVKRGTGEKLGFYELIAERLAVTEEDFDGYVPNETPMDRGTRLQKHAVEKFKKNSGMDVDESLVLWVRDDNESIAISPDGQIRGKGGKLVNQAIETKCLSSARHIEAFLTQEVPDEYKYQVRQYFIVNDKLEKLYLAFYDPRIPAKDFFYLVINRKDIEEEIEELLVMQIDKLLRIDEAVLKLTNF